MFIGSAHVRHFRCIADARLDCEPLTALVGPNGCGKSTFLRAIDLFFASDTKITEDDFYARDTSTDIEITIEFQNVDPAHSELLAPYLQGDRLRITRSISWAQSRPVSRYYGYTQRHDRFTPIRALTSAREQRQIYDGLRSEDAYADLNAWTRQDDLEARLRQWESDHTDQCSLLRDSGTFYGIGAATKFDLSRLVQVVFIPAVRDAVADATDMRGSPITELLDVAFRSGMSERADFRELETYVEEQYSAIIEQAKQQQFREVERRLSKTLDTFVNNSAIKLVWKDQDRIRIPPPSAEVVIVEDDFESPVSRTGHGVQRAFTFSLLQEIAAARVELKGDEVPGGDPAVRPASLPILLLVIEEPELYQHPNQQRSIARTLQQLSEGSILGVADRTQVIYGTHNPHFVAIDRVEQVRVLRKVRLEQGMPKSTMVKRFDSTEFIDSLAACKDPGGMVGAWPFHQMKLLSIMNYTVNEGFFAKAVVLVEGEIDRAGIVAACGQEEIFLEELGVSVIECRGKSNLVRLSIIFRQLGIEVFVVWDGDREKGGSPDELVRRASENRELHRLVGLEPAEAPVTQVGDSFACFGDDLEKQVRCDLGDFYGQFMQSSLDRYGLDKPIKHPVVFRDLLTEAREYGLVSPTLEQIVGRVRAMVSRL